MKRLALMFLGPSGCGKGTQVKLLKEYLAKQDPDTAIVNLVMGDLFRSMWKDGTGFSADLSREINKKGGLQPSFLQVMLWVDYLVNNIKGDEHIIIDGSPRRVEDAQLMESAFDFYGIDRPALVFINTDIEESKRRILHRAHTEGRKDDQFISDVEKRMDWYREFVIPAIDYFRNKNKFRFIEVNGNQDIEGVFSELKAKLFNDQA